MSQRIGITGAAGFIGKHLVFRVAREEGWTPVECTRETFADPQALAEFVSQCDVIVHLAGCNRGTDEEVADTNIGLARQLVDACQATGATPRIIYASSTQEEADNIYGRSKREAGHILASWSKSNQLPFRKLVIPNVYGAGCKPFYNSVVSTFCHQLAHGETPTILKDREVEFICVSELVEVIANALKDTSVETRTERVPGTSCMTVSTLLERLIAFRDSYFQKNVVPDLTDRTTQYLYATFLSYLPANDLRHCPPLHTDPRGSLVEVIKLAQGGQVFFSTTKPGIIRGNHYHTRKVEWFCVLKGQAMIRLRRLGTQQIQEFPVSGEHPEFISIPIMHTHHIENTGEEELLTMFWCNEIFDASDADTYFEKVA